MARARPRRRGARAAEGGLAPVARRPLAGQGWGSLVRSPLFPALSRMRRFGDNISVECQALLPRTPAASIEGAGLQCCSVARLKRCATVAPPFGRVFRMFRAAFARALFSCIGGPSRATAVDIVMVFKSSAAVERPCVPGAPPERPEHSPRLARECFIAPPDDLQQKQARGRSNWT